MSTLVNCIKTAGAEEYDFIRDKSPFSCESAGVDWGRLKLPLSIYIYIPNYDILYTKDAFEFIK